MQAMLKLYPKIKIAMGPATHDGFYFDFESDEKISLDDFPKIEKEMQKIISADLPITKEEISVKEARQLFKDNEYKQEWLDEIEKKGEKVTIYWTGKGTDNQFVDLCSGPHIESTGKTLFSNVQLYAESPKLNGMPPGLVINEYVSLSQFPLLSVVFALQ